MQRKPAFCALLTRVVAGSLLAGVLTARTVAAQADGGAAYVRTLEGTAVLHAADVSAPGGSLDGEERGITLNAPLLAGDRVAVDAGGRLEIGLPDGNVLRLGSRSVLSLDALAATAESNSDTTRVFLDFGELQWITPERTVGREDPRLDLGNATVYLAPGGTYRLETDGRDWSTVTVREGSADVLMPVGTSRLRAGEALEIRGRDSAGRIAAREISELERWGQRLDDEVRWSDLGEVDSHLRYGAARLSTHGGWVAIDGRRAWRPWRVASGWRPFLDGRWVYTPSGWTWVSSEPWGWTTSHYGSWDYVPGYGWAWFPGSNYAPAWVYWYWGNGSAGWCPYGYYSRYYRFGSGHHLGVYGWAGGSGFGFNDWTFCSTRYLRARNLRDHCRRGSDYFDRGIAPRGIITTDTRLVTRGLLDRGDDPVSILSHAVRRDRRDGSDGLPDVSDFISRRRDLPAHVAKVVESPSELPRPGREPFPSSGGSAASGYEGREPAGRDPLSSTRPPSRGSSGSYGHSPREPYDATPGRPRTEPRPAGPATPREPWVASPRPEGGGSGREPSEPPVRRVIDGTRTPRVSTLPAPHDPIASPLPPSSGATGSGRPSGTSSSGGGREPVRSGGASAGSEGRGSRPSSSGSSGSRGSAERSREKEKSDEPPLR